MENVTELFCVMHFKIVDLYDTFMFIDYNNFLSMSHYKP